MRRVSTRPPAVGRIQGITGVQQDPLRRAVEIVVVVLDLHAVAVDGDFLQQPLAARAIVRTVGIIRPVSGSPLGVVNKRTVPLSNLCLTQTQEQFKSPFLSHFIPQVSAYRHIVFHIPIPRNISF